MSKIFCIAVVGKPLTAKIADVLVSNAYDMLYDRKKRARVKGKGYDGVLTTDLQSVSFVGTTGVIFNADIVTKRGRNEVKYIIREKDLDGIEKMEWFGLADLPE